MASASEQNETPAKAPERDYSDLRAQWVVQRPELLRRRPRLIAGVCRGLSVHLGGSVVAWRVLAAVFAWTGIVPLAYIFLSFALPLDAGKSEVDPKNQRVAPRLQATESRRTDRALLFIGLLLIAIAALLVLNALGVSLAIVPRVLPYLVILGGLALVWMPPFGDNKAANFAFAGLGTVIVLIGGGVIIARNVYADPWQLALTAVGLTVTLMVLLGYPLYLRSQASLRASEKEKIREAERADIAAHLHDSVLQTLALIRAQAHDAETVRMLARSQEQDLRRYLYSDRSDAGSSTATLLTELAGKLERRYGRIIDLVVTGDTLPTPALQDVVAAVGEAITNACKHTQEGTISVYAELSDGRCEVWVRDRGAGFDVASVASDRAGIRDSIVGRMQKIGGTAKLRSPLHGGGTEVYLGYDEAEVQGGAGAAGDHATATPANKEGVR